MSASLCAVINRDHLSQLLGEIKRGTRKEAVSSLRNAVAKSVPMENDNKGDRQRIEIDLVDGVVAGFTVTFDGVPVFKYIGPHTATELPRMFLGRITQRLQTWNNTWRDEFILSFGTGFWARIYAGCNGGVPFVMEYREPVHAS